MPQRPWPAGGIEHLGCPGCTCVRPTEDQVNPSHAAIKISINATAAEFICKNIFPTPVQIKKK